ncbi:thioester reductase domain-containing protein [Lipingzhangella sp. LS1_29]|uniref:Thioester reductase domain-containing protein n=1 Tax=Lipingzhangella rawalii TaxID=2055835 RepID=A0ABU2H891_9ACTN|nr:thioester reductase domain-containing protein [Lipingzhangella rawalii]MDS1271055.1 thioester reductase domain-containing protein [Lipingzhangella rawalii]
MQPSSEPDSRAYVSDLTLPAEIDPSAAPTPSPEDEGAILLTGATGYLGGFLLATLLERTRSRICCVVRGRTPEEAYSELHASLAARGANTEEIHRVDIIVGNIAKPRLGLTPPEYEYWSERVHSIYHCAAWVNLVSGYKFLRNSNVVSTTELLKFATFRRRIPFHHISTLGTIIAGFAEGWGVVTEDMRPPQPLPVGYYESKWVSESRVCQARERGLPARIYRPGAILGDSTSGFACTSDWLAQLTQACVRVGSIPTHNFQLPVSCADFTATCIVRIATEYAGPTGVFHPIAPTPMPLETYFSMVRAERPDLDRVPYDRWLDLVRTTYGPSSPVYQLSSAVPRFLPSPENGVATYASADTTLACLEPSPMIPPMDRNYFSRFLAHILSE